VNGVALVFFDGGATRGLSVCTANEGGFINCDNSGWHPVLGTSVTSTTLNGLGLAFFDGPGSDGLSLCTASPSTNKFVDCDHNSGSGVVPGTAVSAPILNEQTLVFFDNGGGAGLSMCTANEGGFVNCNHNTGWNEVPATAPAISGTPPTNVPVNAAYSFTFILGGAPQPFTAETSGPLPPGLTLSNDGTLSGTPTTAGTYAFTVSATNVLYFPSASDNVSVTVLVPGFHVTTTSLSPATRGSPYSDPLAAAGGKTPYKWKKTAALPKGLKLSSTGLLSGTPSAKLKAGNYSIAVSVTDSSKPKQTAMATLTLMLS
jgi:hypothetical protein